MKKSFTQYEILVIILLTVLQFTIILDFMVLSPLSAILLPELAITTKQFGLVVSAYAWSAGLAGLLAAGFADRFDRKKLLIFFYSGFLIGTLLCGLAPDYPFLLMARIVTGIFGGVIGAISFAIITDLFPIEVRGRAIGFLQMAFAGAQVLGLPIGLYLANHLGWHSPFLLIVGLGLVLGVAIVFIMKPVNAHLAIPSEHSAVEHLINTIKETRYLKAFAATTLLATGGFMLMPFGSAFSVNNLGISVDDLPMMYMITGVCTMIASPLIGKLSDAWGKYTIFMICSLLLVAIVIAYCNLSLTPLWIVIIFSVVMFINVSGRIISASALFSAVPAPKDRGAFMSVNSSVQMVSGGIASLIAGTIVYQDATGKMINYPILGYVVSGATVITVVMMYFINRMVVGKQDATPKPVVA